MLGFYKNNAPVEFKVGGNTTGHRFDRIELTESDFFSLNNALASKEASMRVVEWFAQLECRVVPKAHDDEHTTRKAP